MPDFIPGKPYILRRGNQTFTYRTLCGNFTNEMYNSGLWYGEDPLNSVVPVFMLQIILVFSANRVTYFLLRPFRQSQFLCNIIGGILIGPSGLGSNEIIRNAIFPAKASLVLNTIGTIGITCFIFITAVKTDLNLIRKASKPAWIIGIIGYIVPYLAHVFLFRLSHNLLPKFYSGPFVYVLSIICSSTYGPVIVQSLKELKILDSELGQLATSVSLISLFIGLIQASLMLASVQDTASEAIRAILAIAAFVCFIIFAIRPGILWVIKITPEDKPVHEVYIIAIILGSLVVSVVGDMLGATLILGALLMGLIIPDGPPLGSTLIEKLDVFVRDLFMPILYVRVGANTDFYSIKDWELFATLYAIIVGGHIIRATAASLTALFFRISPRNAFILGIVVNIWGVVEYTGLTYWQMREIMDKQSHATFVLVNLASTAISCPLIELFYKPQRLVTNLSTSKQTRSLQTSRQDQELCILACIHTESNVHGMVSVFEASNPNTISPLCVYLVHLIQFVGREVPLLVPFKRSKKRNLPNRSNHIMAAFEKYSASSNGPVALQPFSLIAPYKTMHGSICNLAQDKQIPLIILPLCREQAQSIKTNELRKLTAQIQADASCTVGILVEKNSDIRMDLAHFSYNIAVLFLGGADDREVLTLAIRMSGNPSVSINVLRIKLNSKKQDLPHINETEKLLDDMLIKEFSERNFRNACTVCQEIVAEDNYMHITNVVKSLQNSNYDLVMVGKRRAMDVTFEEEIIEWMEYPELGGIGDILASLETDAGKMSVLVLQQSGTENVTFNQSSLKFFGPDNV